MSASTQDTCQINKENKSRNNFVMIIPKVQFKVGSVLRQYATIIVANFSMLHVGLEIAWLSPVLVKVRDANQTVLSHPITEDEGSWMVSVAPLSGIFVMFFTGYLMDRLGRKSCILLSMLPRIVMCALCTFASRIWMLLAARALCGVSTGLILSAVPTYTSEIASKEIRGALGTISQVLSAIGMMILLAVGPYASYLTLNIVMSSVVIALFIPQLFLPESPYFLYVKGKEEESLKILTYLRDSEEKGRDEIKQYTQNDEECISKMELLKDRVVLKTICKVVFLSCCFQMVGYNALSVYLQTILESTRTSLTPESSSVIIGCIQLLACVCTIFLTDRFGRKPILVISLLGMTLGMVGLGTFFKITEAHKEVTGFLNFLPLICLILIVYCFNAGLGSITWMLIAELFDGPTRALGVSFGVFTTTISVFITNKYFASAISVIGPASTYWMFGGNCFITCLFILFFIPETKGRTFAEIQKALGRKAEENRELKETI